MASNKPTVAFFGATGGCAGSCLAASLKAGHKCSALARTPSKLTASLKEKGVTEDELAGLRIVQGDARDVQSVADALKVSNQAADIVISGIGGSPKLQWSLREPIAINEGEICFEAAETLLKALRNTNQSQNKPLVVAVSTTGISPSNKPRDIPLAYTFLYKWLLHVPHQDKVKMESAFRNANSEPAETKPLKGFVAVKPTLLMDGPAIGLDKIRAGTEDRPAIGYTIKRQDTGEWMYANLIAKEAPSEWFGKGICLTS